MRGEKKEFFLSPTRKDGALSASDRPFMHCGMVLTSALTNRPAPCNVGGANVGRRGVANRESPVLV